MERFTDDIGSMREHRVLKDYLIEENVADWMPDICLWTPFPIVRDRVRAFLDARDPEGNQFFPMSMMVKETGAPLADGPYFWWMPRRRV